MSRPRSDWISGKIVEWGRAHNVRTPYNFTIVALIQGLEMESGHRKSTSAGWMINHRANAEGPGREMFAGIDVGTTTTKAVVIDTGKNILGMFRAALGYRPCSWRRQRGIG